MLRKTKKLIVFFFLFRKEEQVARLERELANEKKRSERVLENMVGSIRFVFKEKFRFVFF